MNVLVLSLLFALTLSEASAVFRFTDQSCSDLVPRNFDPTNYDEIRSTKRRPGNYKKKRHDMDSVPYRIFVQEKRYRRNTDLTVTIEGGYFEGMLLQSRVVSGGELLRGGVSLIGQFRYLPDEFVYLPCFDIPYATVIDRGQPGNHQNISFTWTAPDTEMGDIKFIASVTYGLHYLIIVSRILPFNPFPISAYGCGTTLGCYRLCPADMSPCGPKESNFILTYRVDPVETGEVQFTMGGRIPDNNTYVAVAFGEDYESLTQADMVVCYISNGRIQIEHLHIEGIKTRPISHIEALDLEDSDLDGDMLWCRFNRRPFYSYKQSFFQFYFFGSIDYYQSQRFVLPSRSHIYASAFRRNFTHPFNEIVAGTESIQSHFFLTLVLMCLLGLAA